MKRVKCYLCGCTSFEKVPGRVRDVKRLHVMRCMECGLTCLNDFSHADKKYYREAKMDNVTTVDRWNAWLFETSADDDRRVQMLKQSLIGKDVLDFGCGSGGFLLKAKLFAGSVIGVELNTFSGKILRDHGIPVVSALNELSGKTFDCVTLFHLLEHIPDPIRLLKQLAAHIRPEGRIIIEVPNANDALLSLYQSDAFSRHTFWSGHLFTYSDATLRRILRKAGYDLLYCRQIQRYPLSNHLYWLSKGLKGGHGVWDFLNNPDINRAYEGTLAASGLCDTLLVGAKVIR